MRFSLFGCQFELNPWTPALREAMTQRLPPVNYSCVAAPVRRYAARPEGEGFRVARARRRPVLARDVTAAADLIVEDVERTLSRHAEGRIFIHAGAVSWHDRAILLPGVSGSGKSELVAALLHAGAGYLSDEFAVLDREGWVHPYARPVALRRAGGIRHVEPEALGAQAERNPLPVGAIALFRFRHGQPSSLTRLSPGQTLLNLFRHTLSARARFEDARRILRKVAENTSAVAGTRGDAAEAAARLLQGH